MPTIYDVDSGTAPDAELAGYLGLDQGLDPPTSPGGPSGGGASGAMGLKLDALVILIAGDAATGFEPSDPLGVLGTVEVFTGDSGMVSEASRAAGLWGDGGAITGDSGALVVGYVGDTATGSEDAIGASTTGDAGLVGEGAEWSGSVYAGDSGTAPDGVLTALVMADAGLVIETPFPETILRTVEVLAADFGTGAEASFLAVAGGDTGVDMATAVEAALWSGTIWGLDQGYAADLAALAAGIIFAVDMAAGSEVGTTAVVTAGYYVYDNTGIGDPINYATPIATLYGLETTTWTSTFELTAPGTWSFGVRAWNENGIEENLDCSVTIVIDASGNDITNMPSSPIGLRAFATAGAGIRIEWYFPLTRGPTTPLGFNVYWGTSGTPNYSVPVVTVPFAMGYANTFVANAVGTNGTTYTIGVRAYNAVSEESNTVTVTATADSTGPSAVTGLSATAVV